MTGDGEHGPRLTALVTDGGRGSSRSALAATRALHRAGHRVGVTVSAGEELAAVSKASAASFEVPPVADGPAFVSALDAIRAHEDDPTVFAASDAALRALDVPGTELVDKQLLAARAAELDIAVPEGEIFPDVAAVRESGLAFPVVLKPTIGAEPAVRVDRADDLAAVSSTLGRVVVQPYLTGEMVAVAGVIWDGELRAAVHQRYERRWPIECGTASAAVTVEPDVACEEDLVRLLGPYRGVFQAQYIGRWLIDVNPRPYGSMALATAAGVNLPALVCALSTGARAEGCERAEPGVRYRWIEGDVRHVVTSLRRRTMTLGEAGAALRPRSGTAHSVMSLHDPRPAALRARQVLRRARKGAR